MTDKDPHVENRTDAFLRRVVLRGGVNVGEPGRFPCGHLQELRRDHLLEGEHFPYGAKGAILVLCAICKVS